MQAMTTECLGEMRKSVFFEDPVVSGRVIYMAFRSLFSRVPMNDY